MPRGGGGVGAHQEPGVVGVSLESVGVVQAHRDDLDFFAAIVEILPQHVGRTATDGAVLVAGQQGETVACDEPPALMPARVYGLGWSTFHVGLLSVVGDATSTSSFALVAPHPRCWEAPWPGGLGCHHLSPSDF